MKYKDIFNHPYAGVVSHSGEEFCKGKSETVPGAALTIAEVYRRSVSGAMIPDISYPTVDPDTDEDFGDAIESGVDMIDAYDNEQKLTYYEQKIKALQEQKRRMKSEEVKPKQTDKDEIDDVSS